MEVINLKVIGKIDKKYRSAASAFQVLGEYQFLPLLKFEPSERRARLKFYEALMTRTAGGNYFYIPRMHLTVTVYFVITVSLILRFSRARFPYRQTI